MSKTCDDADIEYRKQYSAPAGALTFTCFWVGRIYIYIYFEPTINISRVLNMLQK